MAVAKKLELFLTAAKKESKKKEALSFVKSLYETKNPNLQNKALKLYISIKTSK